MIKYENMNFQTTVFQCSKTYGSPTCVTRLNVAPNYGISTKLFKYGIRANEGLEFQNDEGHCQFNPLLKI